MKPQRPLLLFIRKLLPISRRALSLFFKGRSKPSFELFHTKNTSGELIDTKVNLRVNNGLILQVNGHSMPIYSDDQTITLKVPNSSSKLEIIVRGLFGSVVRVIDVQESVVRLSSQPPKLKGTEANARIIDRKVKISERNVAIHGADLKIKTTGLSLNSDFSLYQINNSFRTKKLEPKPINNLSIKDVSEELETALTTNKIHYEK